MKSPKDMIVIQIDITNACIHQCSNCTRFCGHHKKPFFMGYETFKRAVQSLDGYVGVVGLMGGEPTLHPEFKRMVKYLASHKPPMKENRMQLPQIDIMDAVHDLEYENTFPYPMDNDKRPAINGVGLWTTNIEGYKRYYEVIQDNIKYQMINDHSNPMYHQPILISRKSLGIKDDEWYKLRDNCWIQNTWSASITPKGAFFCEVAGALDMLFDGPGGWDIEPGWWQRTPEEFGDQLHWCEMCGIACHTFTRDANEARDDVSEDIYERLKEIQSPKVGKNLLNVIKVNEAGEIAEESKAAGKCWDDMRHPYTDSYDSRFDKNKNSFFYKKIIGIFVCRDEDEMHAVKKNVSLVEESYILAAEEYLGRFLTTMKDMDKVHVYSMKEKNLGTLLYLAISGTDYNTYCFVVTGNVDIKKYLLDRLDELVLNPGTLLYTRVKDENEYFSGNNGIVALLNGQAETINKLGWDRIIRLEDLDSLREMWTRQKVVSFNPSMERTAPTDKIKKNGRYIIYAAGNNCNLAIQMVMNGGGKVIAVTDSDKNKWGNEIGGIVIQSPDILKEKDRYDYVLISTNFYYSEIKQTLFSYGLDESRLALR